MSYSITFQNEGVSFTLKNKQAIRKWIAQIAQNHGCRTGAINYIFCSDEHLLLVNKQYLNHDYYTDIITFDYTENKRLAGDIFISIDRVADNAQTYKTTFEQELYRVLIHGILHLAGYKDKGKADEKLMRKNEDDALALINF